LGFTTLPAAGRSSVYATDVAKMVQAPILHVNGDDPEACVRVARLAVAYRQAFAKDVVVDLVCYRLHGHNEGDDPSYTQPLMYRQIERHRSVRKLFTEALVKRGDITFEEAEQALDDFAARLQRALDETRSTAPEKIDRLPERRGAELPPLSVATGVPEAGLRAIAARLHSFPEGFHPHPKLARQVESRAQLFSSGVVDWALGEALALGSLLAEGVDVRLSGQDTRRGTFSQRHAVVVDVEDGGELVPLAHLDQPFGGQGPVVAGRAGRFLVYDSLLSEYAALAFEYGYSVEARDALVAWEAQFGDFSNGAQIVIDQFVVAAEEKWGQTSGLVLLLPHGYEGQGAEHSSARLERFLTLAADDNITVAQPTTASQYFHVLRSQARRSVRKPLVVMTPKSLLRSRPARSPLAELIEGSWRPVLDDPGRLARPSPAGENVTSEREGDAGGEGRRGLDPDRVERIVCCSGKIAYDALARRGATGGPEFAVVRIEQLYPWPEQQLESVLRSYGAARELVWLQDEPENMGAWSYVHGRLHAVLRDRYQLRHVSREASGSPATGSHALHELELEDLLERALGPAASGG
ncbi:MAG TPA: thiamine pyrophosphate-dependent enzyme, partial [Acidimicrobiales bacterium]|nr:thiamine pyrophosphate-dependent enzyme [Acidimicrobiales bacterium]